MNNREITENNNSSNERYNYFIEELRSIVIESIRVSREEVIKGKWEMGKRIVQEEMNFEKGVYGERTIKTIAKDLHTSPIGIYKVIQFYKKYPKERFEDVMEELPFGNNISWHKIIKFVLPEEREEEDEERKIEEEQNEENCSHPIVQCKKCNKSFTFENFLELTKEKNNN